MFFRCFFTLNNLICELECHQWKWKTQMVIFLSKPLNRFCLFFAHYVFMHPSPTVFPAFLGRSQPAVQQLKNSSKHSHLAVTYFSHCCLFHLCPKLVLCVNGQLWNQKIPPIIYLSCLTVKKTCWSTKFSKSDICDNIKSSDDSQWHTHSQALDNEAPMTLLSNLLIFCLRLNIWKI